MLDSTTKTRAKSADAAPAAVAPRPPRLRRRPLLIVLAVAMVAVGALVGVSLWNASLTGADVVVVRVAVGRGEVIEAADLGTARVGVDPALRTVPASALQGLVGQRALSDLAAGALLTPDQVGTVVVPGQGETLVGVPISPGLMPTGGLQAGDRVRLVQTPGQSGEVAGVPVTIPATVVSVTPGDTQTVVNVVVSTDRAAELAARAGTGRVALVVDSRAR